MEAGRRRVRSEIEDGDGGGNGNGDGDGDGVWIDGVGDKRYEELAFRRKPNSGARLPYLKVLYLPLR